MEGTSRMIGLNEHQFEAESSFIRDVDDESKSGSDNYDPAEEQDVVPPPPAVASGSNTSTQVRKMKYHRHTPSQIQELENLFKECPHPDEKQRLELGGKLGLDSRQVKFWFQNRRTQLKTQLERHENVHLKQEYEKLKLENIAMREYIHKPQCKDCGGVAVLAEVTMEERKLRAENVRLKEELVRVTNIAENLLGRPLSAIVSSSIGNNVEPSPVAMGVSNAMNGVVMATSSTGPFLGEYEASMYLQVAIAAMDELITLAQNDPPFWIRDVSGTELFNHEEYVRKFNPYAGNPHGHVFEATREVASVIINSVELVNTLMCPKRWAGMFPAMIGAASTVAVLCNGVGGSHDGELILMDAELLFPTPYIPMRHLRFLRYCKKHTEGAWAVVDISIDPIRHNIDDKTKMCRRLPSGLCIVQDVATPYSLVTCVEHAEYDESVIHNLFRPVVQSGFIFGAQRWIATLKRQCEYAAFFPTTDITPLQISIGITREGRKSIMKLARRIIDDFCTGVCYKNGCNWDKLTLGDLAPDLQVMSRVSIDQPGVHTGIALSFSTTVWMPVPRDELFQFLRNFRLRNIWDMLANEEVLEETVKINKSADPINAVSILCTPADENCNIEMLVVQETWSDKTISAVVYSAIDIPEMTAVMEGGDHEIVKLLPSGFLVTDSLMEQIRTNGVNFMGGSAHGSYAPASLLTLGFQVLMNTIPTAKLTVDSVKTVIELMDNTIAKVKEAMHCN